MIAALSSTTLSAAIDDRVVSFQLASTTGVTGLGSVTTAQSVLAVGGELMLVQAVPVSGTVEVIRGVGGTRARRHANAQTVYIGAKDAFDFERSGEDGLVGLAGAPTPLASGLPYYRLPLGTKVADPNTGYEYRLVDYQAVFSVGDWVVIDANGLASALSTTTKGRVGVVLEATTSDNWGWVLVAGSVSATFDTDVTTGCVLIAGASLANISTSTGGNVIFGATCTAAPDSTNSDLGTAYLDNPWCYGLTTDIVP